MADYKSWTSWIWRVTIYQANACQNLWIRVARNKCSTIWDNKFAENLRWKLYGIIKNEIKEAEIITKIVGQRANLQYQSIRPHIIACIVRNLTFNEKSLTKFIQLQSKHQEGIHEKRNEATLATHNLNLIRPGMFSLLFISNFSLLLLIITEKYLIYFIKYYFSNSFPECFEIKIN